MLQQSVADQPSRLLPPQMISRQWASLRVGGIQGPQGASKAGIFKSGQG